MIKIKGKNMIPKDTILRVVRLTDNLKEISHMYCKALGFEVLGKVEDQDEFDGMVLGHPQHAYHIEFSRTNGMDVVNDQTQNNFLVFYLPCSREWERACRGMIDAGFVMVKSYNPFWNRVGRTFEDIDGCRVVLQNRDWSV